MVDWRKLFVGVTVKPPAEVFEEGISEWRNSLIGQFIGAAPNFSALQRTVDALWGKNSLSKVSMAGSNLYLFSFVNATVRDWVLENGPWHIQHKPLVLRKWEPSLRSLDFDLKKMPIWVQFYNVPLELFLKEGLSYIASTIGVPLYMDTITASKARLEFTKLCIEVDVGMKIPGVVLVQLKDGFVIHVRVYVPWMPPSCAHCKVFRHHVKSCPTVVHKDKNVKEKQGWVAKNVEGAGVASSSSLARDNSDQPQGVAKGAEDTWEIFGRVVIADDKVNSPSDSLVVQGDSSGLLAELVTKECVEGVEDFPPLHLSSQKQRGNEDLFDDESVPEARVTRAASLGVAALLQELKTKKKDRLDKTKEGCNGGAVQAGGIKSSNNSLVFLEY
ncbi:hypothetical protein V6N13_140891 [Hibiscus sabdariffa]